MKVYRCIPTLLLVSLAFSLDAPTSPEAPAAGTVAVQHQARPTSPASSKQGGPTGGSRAVAPSAAVISIDGLCQAASEKKHECKTSVTRAQFEALLSALPREGGSPGQFMSPQAKRQFAVQYSHLLTLAANAEKLGLQNSPEGRELVQYARLQALAQVMTHELRGSSQPTPEEIKNYYTTNQQQFAELTLQRVFIPVHRQAEGKTNEVEMRALADDLRQRAAVGTEFSELQLEANKKADIKEPPESRIVLPASALSLSQQAVLQLKQGELSQVIQDASGFFIYKLESSKTLPFDAEEDQIHDTLAELKLKQQVDKQLSASKPVLSPQYFQQSAAPSGPRSARKTIVLHPTPHSRPMAPVGATSSK
jgi:hypothetical protein